MLDNLAYLFIGTALVILATVIVLKKMTPTKAIGDSKKSKSPDEKNLSNKE